MSMHPSGQILRSADACSRAFSSRAWVLAGWLLLAGWTVSPALAQSRSMGRYYPLDQNAPPGVAGQWATVQRGFLPVMQPVRIELPGEGGEVSFFVGPGAAPTVAAPAIVGLRVSSIYRIKIGNMPDFPGVELYPTVEVVDRLHPPRGRENEFAIPIALTAEEIAFALRGRLVTKVIYLEQPNRAAPDPGPASARSQLAGPRDNALALADEAGRPMVIVRLGGRVPDPSAPEPGFFGTCPPVLFIDAASRSAEAARE